MWGLLTKTFVSESAEEDFDDKNFILLQINLLRGMRKVNNTNKHEC